MTTPERIMRRQSIQGLVIILLAIFTVAQSVLFNLEDRDQRECVADKFHELSQVQSVRSKLTTRETQATTRVLNSYAAIALTKDLTEEQEAKLEERFIAALANYQSEIADIKAERRRNPLPPYPVGSCDE